MEKAKWEWIYVGFVPMKFHKSREIYMTFWVCWRTFLFRKVTAPLLIRKLSQLSLDEKPDDVREQRYCSLFR